MKVLQPKQSVEANGITMRLELAEITPSYARFTLCYPKPSAEGWMVGGKPNLQAGAYEAPINGHTLLADADYGGYMGKSLQPMDIPKVASGERCVKIDFLLGHSDPAQLLILTIPALEQSLPEVIPEQKIKQAQAILLAQGIEMDYTTAAGGGGGGGPTFRKLPEGMADDEAYQRCLESLGYLHSGPWILHFELAIVELPNLL